MFNALNYSCIVSDVKVGASLQIIAFGVPYSQHILKYKAIAIHRHKQEYF